MKFVLHKPINHHGLFSQDIVPAVVPPGFAENGPGPESRQREEDDANGQHGGDARLPALVEGHVAAGQVAGDVKKRPALHPAALQPAGELHIADGLHGRYASCLAQRNGGGKPGADDAGCGYGQDDEQVGTEDVAISEQGGDPPHGESGQDQAGGNGAKGDEGYFAAEDGADLFLRSSDGAEKADLPPSRLQVGREGVDNAEAGGADQYQGDDGEEGRRNHDVFIGAFAGVKQAVARLLQIGPVVFGDQLVLQAEFSQPFKSGCGVPGIAAVAVDHGPASGLDLFIRGEHAGGIVAVGGGGGVPPIQVNLLVG